MAENLITALAKLEVDATGLLGQLRKAVRDAGQSGAEAGKTFGKGFTSNLNLADVRAASSVFTKPGGAGGLAEPIDKASKASKNFNQELRGAAIGARSVARVLSAELGPAASEAAFQFQSILGLLRAFGPAAAALAAGAAAFKFFSDQEKRAVQELAAFNRAIKTGDVSQLSGYIEKAAVAAEEFSTQTERIKGRLGFVSITQAAFRISELNELEKQAASARKELERLFNQFERPLKRSQLAQAAAQLQGDIAQFQASTAQNAEQVNAAFDKQLDSSRKQTVEAEKQRRLGLVENARELAKKGLFEKSLELTRLANEEDKLGQQRQVEVTEPGIEEARRKALQQDLAGTEAAGKADRARADELAELRKTALKEEAANLKAEALLRSSTADEKETIERRALENDAAIDRERLDSREKFLTAELEAVRSSAILSVNERRQQEEQLNQDLAKLGQDRARQEANVQSQIRQQALQTANAKRDAEKGPREALAKQIKENLPALNQKLFGAFGSTEQSLFAGSITGIMQQQERDRLKQQGGSAAFNVGGAGPLGSLARGLSAGDIDLNATTEELTARFGNLGEAAAALESLLKTVGNNTDLETKLGQTVSRGNKRAPATQTTQ